jgi:hypothetical protein
VLNLNASISGAREPTIWKVLAFGGAGLLIAAVGTFAVDTATMGQYQLIGTHDGVFWLAILIGMSLLLAGLIGLAYQCGRQGRATIVTGAVLLAVTLYVVGSLAMNIHLQRPFSLFLWPMIAISIIGLVLILRASFRRKD